VTNRSRLLAIACVLVLAAAACAKADPPKPQFSGDISKGNPTEAEVASVEPALEAPDPTPLTAEQQQRLDFELSQVPEGCDVITTQQCLLPFPSDFYTEQNRSTGTGRIVSLPGGQLPNTEGVTFDPTEWNRNDGWSPNTPILVYIPNFDAEATRLPKQYDIEFSTTPESATVIVDLDTGQLVPHWAELDERASSPEEQVLILRPSFSLTETHRFAVGLRRIYGTNGVPKPATMTFQAFRDNKIVSDPRIALRQEEYNFTFTRMAEAGVDRSNLYLAWEFTVAGPDTLAGRLLSMREDAMGRLDGGSPKFAVTEVSTEDLRPGVARKVSGTFEVPLYLDGGGAPGSRMVFNPLNGQPQAVGTYTASFACVIPELAVAKGEALPVVFGHGLLGTNGQVFSENTQVTAAALNAVYCGTNTIGMSAEDLGNVAEVLGDLNGFPSVPDRLQQGILNTLYLGRLMLAEGGLGSDPNFQTGGANLMNTDQAFYDGNSQGAIVGGAATAVAQDWTKAVLGVGGMNYSTLLNRSVDFDQYFVLMEQAYPEPIAQQIWFGLIQMLWDRGETGGYVQHLTSRNYDLTPKHDVLMTVAFGDHQVATVTADNIARTLDIPVYTPELPADVAPLLGIPDRAGRVGDAGGEANQRGNQERNFFDLDPIRKFPATGSALYYWYFGTLPPPQGNITPTMSPEYVATCSAPGAAQNPACADPHGDVRRQEAVIAQKKAFFATPGEILNACRFEPCVGRPGS
jgi:hypothetical protein